MGDIQTTLQINAKDNASPAMKGLSDSLGALGSALGAAGILSALGKAGEAFAEMDRTSIILDKEIENNGLTMGVTYKSIDQLNSAMTKNGLYSEKAAEGADKILLGFQNLKGQIPSITALLPDLAAKMGTDLPEAASVLGKALDKPAMAARLLRQAGMSLTQQQTEQVKQMMHVGDVAGAQAVILGVVKQQTAGMSDAIRNSPFGQNQALKNSIEEVNMSFGKTVDALTGPVKEGITSALQWFLKLQNPVAGIIQGLVIGIGAVAAAMLIFNTVSAMNPLVAIIAGIVVGIGALITAIFVIKNNWEMVSLVAKKVFLEMGHFVSEYVLSEGIIFLEFVQKIIQGIEFIFNPVIQVFNIIIEGINSVLKTHIPTITGLLNSVSDGINKNISDIEKQKTAVNLSYSDQIKAIDKKISTLEKEKKSTEELKKQREALKNADISATKSEIAELQKKLDMTSMVTSSMSSLSNQYFQNELDGAKGNAAKTKEIKQEQFSANKALGVANTIISTIEATMKAMTLDPTGILAIAVGTMGVIETGLIAAQPMPAFAKGGIAPGGFALVGEQGPEIVNLPAGSRVHSNSQSKKMMGGGDIHIHGNIVANDPIEFYRQLSIKTQRFEAARA